MIAFLVPDAQRQRGPVWARALVMVLLAGYLLFAHGCHGDEDNELLDTLPAVQGAAETFFGGPP